MRTFDVVYSKATTELIREVGVVQSSFYVIPFSNGELADSQFRFVR